MSKQTLYLTVGIDVEEDGLFCGKYQCVNPAITNIDALTNLLPLIKRGVRPTLFCAYSALANAEAASNIKAFGGTVEVGIHLHHWNTPPLVQNTPASGYLNAVPAVEVDGGLFDSKLKTMLALAEETLNERPVSFRMGRWDLHQHHWPALIKRGIEVDASVRPLHVFKSRNKGPDHFKAPTDPYWVAAGKILEVPHSVAPIVPLPFAAKLPKSICQSLRHWAAIPLLPVQQPLWLLRLAASIHVSRGGRALCLSWHSSEMQPGATPHLNSRQAVSAFLDKMEKYFTWLEANFNISYRFMREMRNISGFANAAGNGDWLPGTAHAA